MSWPRSPRCVRTLAPRPGPTLTPTATLQSQAGSEAAAESIHGPSRTRRRLPRPCRPRPPMPDLRGPDTFTFTRGVAEGTRPGRGGAPSGLGPTPGAPGRARSLLSPGGRLEVAEGAHGASGRGGATRPHPPGGAPGSLPFQTPRSPNARDPLEVTPYLRGTGWECPVGPGAPSRWLRT